MDGEESGHTLLKSKSQIVSCKKKAIISSFNARTLGPLGRLEELAECSKSQNIDILAIQEHRFHHPNDVLNITRQDPSSLSPRQFPKTPATPPLEALAFFFHLQLATTYLK